MYKCTTCKKRVLEECEGCDGESKYEEMKPEDLPAGLYTTGQQ